MQDQNDNMDDLFRKAADEYPLNVGVPDWNKIARAVSATQTTAPRSGPRYRRFFWLLWLIPFGFVCNYMEFPPDLSPDGVTSSEALHAPANKEGIVTGKTKKPVAVAPGSAEVSPYETNQHPEHAERGNNQLAKPVQDPESLNPARKRSSNKKQHVSDAEGGAGNTANSGFRSKKAGPGSSDKYLTGFPTDNTGQFFTAAGRPRRKTGHDDFDSARPRQQTLSTDNETGISTGISNESMLEPALKLQGTGHTTAPMVAASGNMLVLTAGPVSKNTRLIQDPRFYIGIAGGVDLSTVKLQKLSRTGSQYGGIIGYQFAKRWSVEAGVFMGTKYYYTDGEYFDKGRMTINPTSEILTIEGLCRMYELPVNVKYDITDNFRSNWFVTAGLSSYFMKRENYDMLYLYTGSGSTSMHHYEYKNSSRNFFSQLRLTAGYTYKLPGHFSLRLEPYLNMPVSGVGYGKLKLNSAGINAGIFKRLF